MSQRRLTILAWAGLLCLALGCQETGGSAAPKTGAKPRAKAPEAKADPATDAQMHELVDSRSYVYDPVGKRDPFRSFVLDRVKKAEGDAKGPLEQFDLSQLSVTGVVWQGDGRRALVVDPSGRAYIVSEGDPIGKNEGHVTSIGDSRMTVRETYVDFHGDKTTKEIVMRIRLSQGG